jgi:hypothetical protein
LLILKIVPKLASEFVPAFFPAIGRLSPAFTSYWMQEKSAKMYISLAAFETIVRAKRGYQKTGTSSPKSEEGFNEDFQNVLNLFLFHMRMRR